MDSYSRYWILDSLSVDFVDTGFQSLAEFGIPYVGFRIPIPRNPDSTSNDFPDSESVLPYMGRERVLETDLANFFR